MLCTEVRDLVFSSSSSSSLRAEGCARDKYVVYRGKGPRVKFEFKFARPRASQETGILGTEREDLGLSSSLSSSLRGPAQETSTLCTEVEDLG